jgi:hypothetical protein
MGGDRTLNHQAATRSRQASIGPAIRLLTIDDQINKVPVAQVRNFLIESRCTAAGKRTGYSRLRDTCPAGKGDAAAQR